MMTYVQRFIPNMSKIAAPLRELLKKGVNWYWSDQQQNAYMKLKELLMIEPVLGYYDVTKEITLSVDASQNGLRAVLLQDEGPIAYASKTLNETQCQYAQIEKELLAILYGCERFRQYIYGKSVVVETDHKPLEAIFKKPLDKTPARLQRMRIKLLAYDLQLKYKPGTSLKIPDALSRAHVNNQLNLFETEIEAQINVVIASLNITTGRLVQLREETNKDIILKSILNYIKLGWPKLNRLLEEAKPFETYKEQLYEIIILE